MVPAWPGAASPPLRSWNELAVLCLRPLQLCLLSQVLAGLLPDPLLRGCHAGRPALLPLLQRLPGCPQAPLSGSGPRCREVQGPLLYTSAQVLLGQALRGPLEQCRPPLESLSQSSACCDLHPCLGEERIPASCEGAKEPHGGCCSCCPSVPGLLCRGSLQHNLRRLRGGNFQYSTQALQGSSWLPSVPSWPMPGNRAACCDARAGCFPDLRVPSLGSRAPFSLIPLPQLSTGEEAPCLEKQSRCCWHRAPRPRLSCALGRLRGFLPPAFCPADWGRNRGQSSWRGR